MNRVGIVLATMAAIAPIPSVAETPDAPSASGPALTLVEAKRTASERNWDLLAAKSDVDFTTAQEIVAHEFPNPLLTLSTGKVPVDGKAAGTRSGNGLWERSYDSVAAVNQLFEIGGKRSSRQASARAGAQAAKARFTDARRVLEEAVAKAYIAALGAEANAKILSESADSARKEAQIAHSRLQAGDISRADESRLDVTAERFDLQARAAQSAAVAARIALELLLEVEHPKGSILLADSLEQLASSKPPTDLDAQPETRPDLRAAEASVEQAAAELNLQRALRIPDPTILTQYEHEPPDQPNTMGVGVSFPLPLWNRNRGAILAALAARKHAEAELGKVRAEIAAEVATARSAYQEAVLRWHRQQAEIQPRSGEILKTVEFAYKRGAASLVDLLSAERDDNDVRLATAQAAADTAAALASLRSAFGASDPSLPPLPPP